MLYLLTTLSGDRDLLAEHGNEHDFEPEGFGEHFPDEYYTIEFDSLHELRDFTANEYDVIVSHLLPPKLGDEDYGEVDGTLTIVDGNFITLPHDENVNYI
jgi:hypothetical protein